MAKKRFETSSSIRLDGKIAFSPQRRAIADRRINAEVLSRVTKVLGTNNTFTDEFKAAFDPPTEYEQILDRVHLRKELEATKKVLNALESRPDDTVCVRILNQMRAKPMRRKRDCPLCPIWRHEHETALTFATTSRYAFPRVDHELYLLTIAFDFAENLHHLEAALAAANKSMQRMVAHMGRKRCGVMMVGAFEFDLFSYQQLTSQPKSSALLKELGVAAPESGGWTLTGHFFVRVPHREVLEHWLRQEYPSSTASWDRVRFDKIKENEALATHVSRILSYGGKMPKMLFSAPTRKTADNKRAKADAMMRQMSSAFFGDLMQDDLDDEAFDLTAAIVQWAKFIDRVGAKQMYYSVESAHAQKWYSKSEMDYVRLTDGDMLSSGSHLIEIHRDHGPFPPLTILPHLKGRVRDLRSRRLTFDPEWESMTDCRGINRNTHYHDFDRWTLKP